MYFYSQVMQAASGDLNLWSHPPLLRKEEVSFELELQKSENYPW